MLEDLAVLHEITGNRAQPFSYVGVQDVVVEADIGIHDHEIGCPQPLLITVEVEILPVRDDKIKATLDYTQIVSLAEQLGRKRTSLIETYGKRLASGLLVHPLATRVEVRIVKLNALATGTAFTRIVLRRA